MANSICLIDSSSEHPSLLGVRLPPDTEIIKYTSSIVGPKIPGSTSRGRKKTISETEQQQQQATQKQQHQAEQQQQHLTQQQQQQQKDLESTTNAISSLLAFPGLSPAKRARLEMEYAAMAAAAQQQQHLHGMLGAAAAAGMPMGLGMNPMDQLSSVSKAAVSAAAAAAASSSTVTSTAGGGGSTSSGLNQSHSHGQNASNDRVEVIKLPPTITSNGAYNLSSKGCGKDLHDLTTDPAIASGVNLSLKSSSMPASGAIGSASNPITIDDFDAPLNLSMKPSDKSSSHASAMSASGGAAATSSSSAGTGASALGNLGGGDYQAQSVAGSGNGANSLQSLSSITAALGGTGGMPGGSISGSGSGAGGASPSPGQGGNIPSASGTSSSGSGSSTYKEGRPRNLGRGVSKPKKNTVASLLAQSRAVGLKPMLATQQLLQQGADIVSNRTASLAI